MVRPAGWSGCGSSPTVLASRRGGVIIGRKKEVTFESKGNYMRKCASGGQSLANAERGVSMCGFAGKIDTEFFITNVLLCIIIGNPGPNILVAHFRM